MLLSIPCVRIHVILEISKAGKNGLSWVNWYRSLIQKIKVSITVDKKFKIEINT